MAALIARTRRGADPRPHRAGKARAGLLRALAGGAAAALALAACTPGGDARTAQPGPSGDGVLRIGLLLDNEGESAYLNDAQLAAVVLAVQEANAAGGHAGKPVELLDAEPSADTGAAARRLVEAGADVVIGPTDSSRAPAAIDVLAHAKVTLISPANTSTPLSSYPSSGFYFRTTAAEAAEGAALVELARQSGARSVAVLNQAGSRGKAVADGAKAALGAAGLEDAGSAEFRGHDAAAAALGAQEADAVAVVAHDGGPAILAQLAEAGLSGGRLVLSDGLVGRYGSALAARSLEGARVVVPGVFPSAEFQTAILGQDEDLTDMAFAAEAYDAAALAILAAAVAEDDAGASIASRLTAVSGGDPGTGSPDRTDCTGLPACLELARAGRAVDYEGQSGPVAFDGHGDITTARFMVLRFGADNLPKVDGEVTVAR
ncbi:ABC transporter substrate-binding protein [Sinomonas mesophila]|uniref:ABC transporter substrate-binding protein n=1 Tax=Sinomonas mesophila TaxID=1531955 RepID=UPI0009859E6E|nr:ABC transporter substrate-binding protein [Sinomonas mesophila]